MCRSARDRDAETAVPASCGASSSELHRAQVTGNTLPRRYELVVHQTVGVKQFRELRPKSDVTYKDLVRVDNWVHLLD
jgi:hypothetical protein